MKSKNKIKNNEKFYSMQGEGFHTGEPSIWLRTFGCPLRCSGFSQDNPKDPTTWDIPYKKLDMEKYISIQELPVLNKCCDTYYAIDNQFKHLSPVQSLDEIINDFIKLSPDGNFNNLDLCFTGGEPLMWGDELAHLVYKILTEYDKGIPNRIQFETNSTMKISKNLLQLKQYLYDNYPKLKLYFNISPKLLNVSGEVDAINYENIKYISDNFDASLKFVVNQTDACWEELDEILIKLKEHDINLDIFIMPVGATKEQQEDSVILTQIVNKALKRKLKVSGRLHCNIFGNTPGT